MNFNDNDVVDHLIDKKQLLEAFKVWSKRVSANKNKLAYPSYNTAYSWINGSTKLTFGRLKTILGAMNRHYEIEGFKVFPLKEYGMEDFLK